MPTALRGLTIFCAAALFAQAPSADRQPSTANRQEPKSEQAAGLTASWEIAPVLEEVAAHAARLLAALDKINPEAWVEKGASDTYVSQFQSSKEQAKALADGARALARNPEKLSASIEVLLRIHGLESMVASLAEAIRKYQSPNEAQALIGLSAENGANRDRLQAYVVNLATEREQDLAVMDREAQRCRGIVVENPAPKSGRKK
jgi:hypothetical protein